MIVQALVSDLYRWNAYTHDSLGPAHGYRLNPIREKSEIEVKNNSLGIYMVKLMAAQFAG